MTPITILLFTLITVSNFYCCQKAYKTGKTHKARIRMIWTIAAVHIIIILITSIITMPKPSDFY